MSVGRNDPCICGSGKKYKKCCLGKPDGAIGNGTNDSHSSHHAFESDIDSLSNETIDLIEGKEFAKAEKNCERLVKEFPDCVDGHEMYGDLFSAKGETAKAIESYEKAIRFMKTHSGFEEDGIARLKEKMGELKKA